MVAETEAVRKRKAVVIVLEVDTEADARDVAASVEGYLEKGPAVPGIETAASRDNSVPVLVKSFRVGVRRKGRK